MDDAKLRGAKKAATQIGISVEQYLQHINSGLKWCYFCKKFIPRDLFPNSVHKKDGKCSQCRDCCRVLSRRYYKPVPREQRKSPDRNTYPPRDGDKKQARRNVNNEVRRGKLPRAQTIPCTDCGHIGNDCLHEYDHYLGYAALHHLEVQCVCTSCHHKREQQRRKQQQEARNGR